MKTSIFRLIVFSLFLCSLPIGAQKNVDALLFEECRKAVSLINEMPLTKLYEVNDTDTTATWQMFTGDSIIVDTNDTGDCRNVYVDAEGKLRKYICNSYKEAENTYSLTAYYDENGNLLKLLCDNVFYDTITTYAVHGREYYDIKDANIYGGIFCIAGKVITQTYSRMDHNNNNNPAQYVDTGSQLLPRIGLVDLSGFHCADSVISSLRLDLSTFDLPSGTSICFKGEILHTLKMVNTRKVPVKVAPTQDARVQATVDAGLKANVVEKKFDQFVESYGTHSWYKVTFSTSTNYDPGYIYGAFLEPGESIHVRKRRTWRRSSY